MSKSKKKEKAKQKAAKGKRDGVPASPEDASAVIEDLKRQNEELRARLERISELARAPVSAQGLPKDIEDDEYEELSHDLDDQIAAGNDGQR